ncbi:MAG: dephospho-CoA kinase [Myxococcota bacterium]
MTVVVGLTGGIGTGKSTVAAMLREHGAVIIDSDEIVRALQAPGQPMLEEIAAAFGSEVIAADGSLDRAKLGDIVFRDPEALARLNAIVHPGVGRESAARLARARESGAELVVLDIPLLFETRRKGTASGANSGADAVVVVYAPRELQISRQLERNDYDRAEAERRIDSQISIEEKRKQADHVIDNSGSLEDTARQVRELFSALVAG